ncbi:Threonine dehydratase [Candidatus Terasakiella magnetica]|uniref:L-serine dehydratase n=1 Tax=Candidatus Terasakiella magnetica TaxID=1867952 RepID=A0A1C3RCE3_9PROT|nr:threonine ammonia-lyase [Candidatus Terasakiella magnetica]SCA54949.1 Threonine dehydratase [Candidatus Terasakiella magnetica]
MISIEAIEQAQKTMADHLLCTPLVYSQSLSDLTGAEVFLKLENLQTTGSFKSRGALIKLAHLSKEEAAKGVVAASAGNHAQGVAYHAKRLGIPATIVMPVGTPFNKISKTEGLGAKVIVTGDAFNQARDAALKLVEEQGLTYISPFDDEDIIAGQGVVGLEIIDQAETAFDFLFVPIGGGGLMAGVASAFQAQCPETKLIGVQCDAYPSMHDIYYGYDNTRGGQTIAEGIAVKSPGQLTAPIIQHTAHEIMVVKENAIEQAVLSLMEKQRLIVEGAGAVGLAALMDHKEKFRGKRVCLILSGGNIDSRILSSVLMRGLARDGRMVKLRITLPDQPGSLATIAKMMSYQSANIVEIYHHRMFYDLPVKMTEVDVVVETLDTEHVGLLVAHFKDSGYHCRIISDSEA